MVCPSCQTLPQNERDLAETSLQFIANSFLPAARKGDRHLKIRKGVARCRKQRRVRKFLPHKRISPASLRRRSRIPGKLDACSAFPQQLLPARPPGELFEARPTSLIYLLLFPFLPLPFVLGVKFELRCLFFFSFFFRLLMNGGMRKMAQILRERRRKKLLTATLLLSPPLLLVLPFAPPLANFSPLFPLAAPQKYVLPNNIRSGCVRPEGRGRRKESRHPIFYY